MLKENRNLDLRLDEDARWLLRNCPPDIDWGYDWFRPTRLSEKHFPRGYVPVLCVIVAGKSGNAQARLELLREVAEFTASAVIGEAISDDGAAFVAIIAAGGADSDSEDYELQIREELVELLRGVFAAERYAHQPGYISMRMLLEGNYDVVEEFTNEQIPKLWSGG